MAYKRWMNQLLANLMKHMNLDGWQIEWKFADKPHPDDAEEDAPGCRTIMQITVLSDYQNAKILAYPIVEDYFNKREYWRAVDATIHELSHILTAPFSDFIEPHLSGITGPIYMGMMESQTQKIAMIIGEHLPKSVVPPLPPKPTKKAK